jgi:hypothetical protein
VGILSRLPQSTSYRDDRLRASSVSVNRLCLKIDINRDGIPRALEKRRGERTSERQYYVVKDIDVLMSV